MPSMVTPYKKNNKGGKQEGEEPLFMRSVSRDTEYTGTRATSHVLRHQGVFRSRAGKVPGRRQPPPPSDPLGAESQLLTRLTTDASSSRSGGGEPEVEASSSIFLPLGMLVSGLRVVRKSHLGETRAPRRPSWRTGSGLPSRHSWTTVPMNTEARPSFLPPSAPAPAQCPEHFVSK